MKKPDNISKNDWQLLTQKYRNLDPIIKKIDQDYPIQYLIGHVNFYGLKILVNKNVLIPRFETETLIEKTIKYINKLKLKQASVLEIGAGSGCIGITLKKELGTLEITAIEISRKALKVAKKNAKLNKCKINFINKDIFKYNLVNQYDVIISNPPYIKEGESIDPKTKYEPQIAIYGGADGLMFFEQILQVAKRSLNLKHLVALEIGEEQASNLKKLAKKYFPKDKILIEKDLANKNRYLFIINE